MSKIIAVTGATGSQGGGVVNVMRQVPGWRVKAITRNPSSEAGQRLADEGVEVVQADFDDERSLVQAFQVRSTSCHAIPRGTTAGAADGCARAYMPCSL